jgi:hypothetical protein
MNGDEPRKGDRMFERLFTINVTIAIPGVLEALGQLNAKIETLIAQQEQLAGLGRQAEALRAELAASGTALATETGKNQPK